MAMRSSSSIAVVAPVDAISSRVMTCSGWPVSPSTRLMLVPVTSTLMSAARAPEATASATAAASAALLNVRGIATSPNGCM
jgi:hypothetical protein